MILGRFRKSGRPFFGRRSSRAARKAKRYLAQMPATDDILHLLRQRAESAEDLMRDPVFQETFQRMNEDVVREIAEGSLLANDERTVLFLKLQVISDFQVALMAHINEYETQAVIREAARRQQIEEEAA